jgi:anti-sigma regulatory factor (Ser/Thr protein kinase)
MLTKENILEIAKKKGKLFSKDIVERFQISRQYANILISGLVADHKLIKLGSTRKAFYVLPEYAQAHAEVFPTRYATAFKNQKLEEHKVLDKIGETFPTIKNLSENVRSIFTYAFSEMFNNAIEHSKSVRIGVEVLVSKKELSFIVNDSGIGVFRNVMKQRGLKSELEAIQDLLKGKITTMPQSHSGEGIFFTSRSADVFMIDSFGYQLIVNNNIPDVFVKETKKIKRGTRVVFKIITDSERHLAEVFKKYSNLPNRGNYGFDKTEIRVKLYTIGGVHISRSQARRVLMDLEKFKVVTFDFAKVPMVGQAFADEIFRVFHQKYPSIKLEIINMAESVRFMVERAINEAKTGRLRL